MSVLVWLVPIAILMGLAGLAAFLWSLKNGQYEDLSGAAERILLDDDDQALTPASEASRSIPVDDSTRWKRT